MPFNKRAGGFMWKAGKKPTTKPVAPAPAEHALPGEPLRLTLAEACSRPDGNVEIRLAHWIEWKTFHAYLCAYTPAELSAAELRPRRTRTENR